MYGEAETEKRIVNKSMGSFAVVIVLPIGSPPHSSWASITASNNNDIIGVIMSIIIRINGSIIIIIIIIKPISTGLGKGYFPLSTSSE